MLSKILYIFIAIIFITGCKSSPEPDMPPAQRLGQVQTAQPVQVNQIVIVSAKDKVKRGEYCNITIKGQPGVEYTISATYNNDQQVRTTYKPEISDQNGMAAWTWLIEENTAPGSYGIVISGNNQELRTTYTVTE